MGKKSRARRKALKKLNNKRILSRQKGLKVLKKNRAQTRKQIKTLAIKSISETHLNIGMKNCCAHFILGEGSKKYKFTNPLQILVRR